MNFREGKRKLLPLYGILDASEFVLNLSPSPLRHRPSTPNHPLPLQRHVELGNYLNWDATATNGNNAGGVTLADDECIDSIWTGCRICNA